MTNGNDLFTAAEEGEAPLPEMSVSDVARAVKAVIEQAFGRIRVKGELSRVTVARSGHMYTALKDDSAVLEAVCWKGTLGRLAVRPEEGMEVICTGRMTTFPGRSGYQLVIEDMEPAGEGALLRLLEERKRRLAAEGLFDEGRKLPLPFLPRTIGVITSPTGAVIRDIIHRIHDRFPCHILLWPVQVQGQGAEAGIIRALAGFNKITSANRPDVIILARGGGSLEDLMAFNDEGVVRAVAASEIPVISAVGHETDISLSDFAADRRAPTPTAAAEMAVPVREHLLLQVGDLGLRLRGGAVRVIERGEREAAHLSRIIARPERMIEPAAQRADMAAAALDHAFAGRIAAVEGRFLRTASALRTPAAMVERAALRLEPEINRLDAIAKTAVATRTDRVESLGRLLETLSYKGSLARGYAVVRDADGRHILETVQSVQKAQSVTVEMHNGTVRLKTIPSPGTQ